MIDRFKISGVLSNFSTKGLVCFKIINTEKGQKCMYRIPGRREEVYLYLTILENSNVISINGNLRKWWYGESNVYNDLNYRSYIRCLKYLSEVIEADLFELLQFKIKRVELGVNVRLERKYDRIIPSMQSYPKRNKVNYHDETIMFEGKKFDIKIYDKLKESAYKNISRKKLADRLVESKFCMRFELDIRAKSALKIKREIDSLHSIKDNWNDILTYLSDTYNQIEVVDDNEMTKELEPNSLRLIPLKELLIYQAINHIGMDKTDKIINKYALCKKAEYRKEFRRIFWKYKKRKKESLNKIVSKSVEKRFKELKNN